MTATPPEPPEKPLVNPFDDPALDASQIWESGTERPFVKKPKRSPTTERFTRPDSTPTGAMERMYNAVQESVDSLKPVLNRGRSALGGLGSLWQKLRFWWRGTLPKIRRVLPATLNEIIPDQLITGVAIALLVILLWSIPNVLFGGKPTQARRKLTPTPTIVSAPTAAAPTRETSPSPELPPDPEKIAAIQDQVAEITEQYATGLIQSVQVNFRSNRLTVTVGDGWYSLAAPRQDSLANELRDRAQKLNFSKLEITDGNNDLLARSPVIGESMIVLKRRLEESLSELTDTNFS